MQRGDVTKTRNSLSDIKMMKAIRAYEMLRFSIALTWHDETVNYKTSQSLSVLFVMLCILQKHMYYSSMWITHYTLRQSDDGKERGIDAA